MNWIILILAGLMEVCFTFCLGKTKTATGHEQVWWWVGFLAALSLSMFLLAKVAERLPIVRSIPYGPESAQSERLLSALCSFTSPPPSGVYFSSRL